MGSLNRLTVERFDSVSNKLLAVLVDTGVSSPAAMEIVIRQAAALAVEKALGESTFAFLYAQLCRKMWAVLPAVAWLPGTGANATPVATIIEAGDKAAVLGPGSSATAATMPAAAAGAGAAAAAAAAVATPQYIPASTPATVEASAAAAAAAAAAGPGAPRPRYVDVRTCTLSACQEELRSQAQPDQSGPINALAQSILVSGEVPDAESALALAQTRRRQRRACNLRFIGELYLQRILVDKAIKDCFATLGALNPPPPGSAGAGGVGAPPGSGSAAQTGPAPLTVDNIEATCSLLGTVGSEFARRQPHTVEEIFARLALIVQGKPVATGYTPMGAVISAPVPVTARLRFLLVDLIHLRDNAWRPLHHTADAPYSRTERDLLLSGTGRADGLLSQRLGLADLNSPLASPAAAAAATAAASGGDRYARLAAAAAATTTGDAAPAASVDSTGPGAGTGAAFMTPPRPPRPAADSAAAVATPTATTAAAPVASAPALTLEDITAGATLAVNEFATSHAIDDVRAAVVRLLARAGAALPTAFVQQNPDPAAPARPVMLPGRIAQALVAASVYDVCVTRGAAAEPNAVLASLVPRLCAPPPLPPAAAAAARALAADPAQARAFIEGSASYAAVETAARLWALPRSAVVAGLCEVSADADLVYDAPRLPQLLGSLLALWMCPRDATDGVPATAPVLGLRDVNTVLKACAEATGHAPKTATRALPTGLHAARALAARGPAVMRAALGGVSRKVALEALLLVPVDTVGDKVWAENGLPDADVWPPAPAVV
jgi:hypothetical protein